MRVIGYARVSPGEPLADGLSLSAQESQIRRWAEEMGHELVEVVKDGGLSNTKLLADRPGGAKIAALLDARSPSVGAVVAVRMDRLGRDAVEQKALLKRFRSGKVGLFVVAQKLDLASRRGRARARIRSVFGGLEQSVITQRVAEGVTHRSVGFERIN